MLKFETALSLSLSLSLPLPAHVSFELVQYFADYLNLHTADFLMKQMNKYMGMSLVFHTAASSQMEFMKKYHVFRHLYVIFCSQEKEKKMNRLLCCFLNNKYTVCMCVQALMFHLQQISCVQSCISFYLWYCIQY